MNKHERKKINNRNMIATPPDPAIINSLRRTGYKWYEALLDTIDNSIDAIKDMIEKDPQYRGRIFIKAEAKEGKIESIIIGDNGTGIPADFLPQVLALGKSLKRKEQKKNPRLGVFGMGLKTAGMSLADNITVISRIVGEDVAYANWRPTVDGFSVESNTSADHTELFEKHISTGPGTLVIFEDMRSTIGGGQSDLPADRSSFYRTLKKRAGHAYRHILNPNSDSHVPFELMVGKTTVPIDWDPLVIKHPNTTILIGGSNGEFKKFKDPNGREYRIRMTWHRRTSGGDLSANRDKYDNVVGQYMPGTHYKQGVYWIRQGREIYCNPLWTPRQGISNIYAEVLFEDSGLEGESSPIQMNFGKTDVLLDPAVEAYLVDSVFDPQVKKCLADLKKASQKASNLDLEDICKKLSKDVLTPNTKGNNQSPRVQNLKKRLTSANSGASAIKKSSYRGQSLSLDGSTNVEYNIEVRGWPGEIPFCFEDGGTTYTLVLNQDHTFIKSAIMDTLDKGDSEGAAYLIQVCAAIAQGLHEGVESMDERNDTLGIIGYLLSIYDKEFGRVFESNEDTMAA